MVQFLSQYRKVDLIDHLLPYFFVSLQVNWDRNNDKTFISNSHSCFFLLVTLIDTRMQSFYFELWPWCKQDACGVLEHVPCRPVHEPRGYDSLAQRVSPPSPDVYQLGSVDLTKTRTLTSSLQLFRSAMTLTGISLTVSLLHDSNHDYMGDDC
jgi:hypothetical protein